MLCEKGPNQALGQRVMHRRQRRPCERPLFEQRRPLAQHCELILRLHIVCTALPNRVAKRRARAATVPSLGFGPPGRRAWSTPSAAAGDSAQPWCRPPRARTRRSGRGQCQYRAASRHGRQAQSEKRQHRDGNFVAPAIL